MNGATALALGLALLAALPGCAQPDAARDDDATATTGPTDVLPASSTGTVTPTPRPDRDYLFVKVIGTLVQSPAHEGQMASCGRPATSYAGVDLDAQALVVVQGRHAFDWEDSWVAVLEDVDVQQDADACGFAWMHAAEDTFEWTFRDVAVSIAPDPEGARVDGTLVRPGEFHVVHVDTAGPGGSRITGDVDVRVEGRWRVRDIVEVASEAGIDRQGGYWSPDDA